MRSKKQSTKHDAVVAAWIFGIFVLFFFSLIAFPYYFVLKHKYLSPPPARRINDFQQFFRAAIKATLFFTLPSLLALGGIFQIANKNPAWPIWFGALAGIYATCLLIGLVIASCWLAAVHFGTVVDPTKDRVVFRVDQESYDLIDYFTLKFISDLPKFDTIQISAIECITRMHGTDLYLMGDFGSRRISFVKKQKRDECIFALTSCGLTQAKLMAEFEST